jgi:glycosyltransferase involved in cell wall biosynthesis
MERAMSELAKYFEKNEEIEVSIILYGKTRTMFFSVPNSITIYKPSFIFTDHSRIASTFKTLFFIRRIIKKIKPDTILSFGEYWNSFVLLALAGLDFPIFISDRCQPTKSLGKLHDRLRRWLYPTASGIIAQTTVAKEIYQRQNLNKNIRVIGNPIYQISANGNPQEKENIILTVGRLIESKHHDRLIRIFKDLSLSEWNLVIVGGNALKQNGSQKLKQLVKELGINDKVQLTGTVSDIAPYYNRSKIFALTSSSEGFPNAIGEAMSAGLPVISYDCVAGPSDMIDNGKNGFLIPLYDDELFANKLNNLIENRSLRVEMGKKSREKVQMFSIGNIGKQYHSFILNDL